MTMKTMNFIFFLFFILLVSCATEKNTTVKNGSGYKILNKPLYDPNGERNTKYDETYCNDQKAWSFFEIDGIKYVNRVYYINNKNYVVSINGYYHIITIDQILPEDIALLRRQEILDSAGFTSYEEYIQHYENIRRSVVDEKEREKENRRLLAEGKKRKEEENKRLLTEERERKEEFKRLLAKEKKREENDKIVALFMLDECPKLESTYGEKAVAISYATMCELLGWAGYGPSANLPKTEEAAMRKGLKDYAAKAKSYLDKGKTVSDTFRLMSPHFTQSNLFQAYDAYMNLIKIRTRLYLEYNE